MNNIFKYYALHISMISFGILALLFAGAFIEGLMSFILAIGGALFFAFVAHSCLDEIGRMELRAEHARRRHARAMEARRTLREQNAHAQEVSRRRASLHIA